MLFLLSLSRWTAGFVLAGLGWLWFRFSPAPAESKCHLRKDRRRPAEQNSPGARTEHQTGPEHDVLHGERTAVRDGDVYRNMSLKMMVFSYLLDLAEHTLVQADLIWEHKMLQILHRIFMYIVFYILFLSFKARHRVKKNKLLP